MAAGGAAAYDGAATTVPDRRQWRPRAFLGRAGSAAGRGKERDVDGPSIAALEAALRREWLSPQEARQLAGVSYAWLRLLGERKQIATLATPLGRLYRRADAEHVRAERAARGGARRR